MSANPASTALFADAVATGTMLAVHLPLLGVVLALRREWFLGAAIAQSGTFGIALALAIGVGAGEAASHGHAAPWPILFGLLMAAATGVFAMRRLSLQQRTVEERSAFVFLFAGSASLLLLSNSPHGTHEIQRLVLSSLLGATRTDTFVAALSLVATVAAALRWPRGILLWATDPTSARAGGAHVAFLDVAIGGWIGSVIGFAIHDTGLPFTFGCTVLPVLCARAIARSLRGVLVAAPIVGALAFAVGWYVGDSFDLPPGQCVVAVLCAMAALLHLVHRR